MRALFTRLFRTMTAGSEAKRYRESLERALHAQRAGYDIGFSFLPRFPDIPFLYICDGRADSHHLTGVGFDCFSKADAFAKTLSETLERVLWDTDNLYWREYAVEGPASTVPHAISLSELAGFSEAQRLASPRLMYTDSTPLLWSRGEDLCSREALFVPAQLVSGMYASEMGSREPLLRIPNSNGLATHTSFDEAARRGLLELIERDAFMITFFNMLTPPRIDHRSVGSAAAQILDELGKYDIECDLLLLPTDMPVSVVVATLRDRSGSAPAFVLGARASDDGDAAIVGALTEALGVYHLARASKLYEQELPSGPLRAHERIAYWGKTEHLNDIEWLLRGPAVTMPVTKKLSLKALASATKERGCRVGAIRMTPPKLDGTGLVSVCVFSPELQPLNLDSAPDYRGGARLRSVPEALGYTARSEPPPYPHPFP